MFNTLTTDLLFLNSAGLHYAMFSILSCTILNLCILQLC